MLTATVAIVAFFVTFVGFRLISGNIFGNTVNVDKTVSDIKTKLSLPTKVDEYTTLTDVTNDNGAIKYQYTISGINTDSLTNESLKKSVSAKACSDTSVTTLLNQNVKLEYAYIVADSQNSYSFSIVKADC